MTQVSIKSNKEILEVLRLERTYLREKFGVVSIAVFGSYAKGEERLDSDIDILVELREPRFDHLAGLQIYLEEKFEKRVELIRKRKGLGERFLKRVEESMKYA